MRGVFFLLAPWCPLLPGIAEAQGLTGSLIGTVKDAQAESFQARSSVSLPPP